MELSKLDNSGQRDFPHFRKRTEIDRNYVFFRLNAIFYTAGEMGSRHYACSGM